MVRKALKTKGFSATIGMDEITMGKMVCVITAET